MNFTLSLSVVFPLLVYILLGIFTRKSKLLDEITIAGVNKLTFRVFFPLLMFNHVRKAGMSLAKLDNLFLILFFMGATIVSLLVGWFLAGRLIPDQPATQASFIQGIFRSNAVLFAIPIVSALCGAENTGFVSVCAAVIVPFYNLVAVLLIEVKLGTKMHPYTLLKELLSNPLIAGAIAGLLFMITGFSLPKVIDDTITALTSIVTPLALIMLGAKLELKSFRKNLFLLCVVAFLRLIFFPALVVFGVYIMGVRDVELISVFAVACVPTAVSSYTMAQQMGADEALAGEIVAFTTLCSMLTVFLWISALSGTGIIR